MDRKYSDDTAPAWADRYGGPAPDIVDLARGSDAFLAKAAYAERVPAGLAGTRSSGREAGENAGSPYLLTVEFADFAHGLNSQGQRRYESGSGRLGPDRVAAKPV